MPQMQSHDDCAQEVEEHRGGRATDEAKAPHSPHSPEDRRRAIDPVRIRVTRGGEEENHCRRRR